MEHLGDGALNHLDFEAFWILSAFRQTLVLVLVSGLNPEEFVNVRWWTCHQLWYIEDLSTYKSDLVEPFGIVGFHLVHSKSHLVHWLQGKIRGFCGFCFQMVKTRQSLMITKCFASSLRCLKTPLTSPGKSPKRACRRQRLGSPGVSFAQTNGSWHLISWPSHPQKDWENGTGMCWRRFVDLCWCLKSLKSHTNTT